MAFDPALAFKSYIDLGFYRTFGHQELHSIRVNEVSTTFLPGRTKHQSFDLWENAVMAGKGEFVITGQGALTPTLTFMSKKDREAIRAIVNDRSYAQLINGIMPQQETLPFSFQWIGNIEFEKDLSYVATGANLADNIPGTDNISAVGSGPYYNQIPGVFNLESKPVVRYVRQTDSRHIYELDVTSVRYLFNPDVLEAAEIRNISQELIATEGAEIFC
jgi:hypothetical protein